MGYVIATGVAVPGFSFSGNGRAYAQGLTLDKAGSASNSPEVTSPQMRELLPLIMKQLQSNPELMSQFGLGGLSGLGGLDGAAGLAGDGAGGASNIPGLNDAIAKALAQKNANANAGGGAGAMSSGIPEQVKLYRDQYHPVDINQDGRISADEAASYSSWMFRRRDINGDGVLMIREFSAVELLPGSADANRQRLRTESRRLELLFPAYDANSDQMISKDEFLDQVRLAYDEKRGTNPDIDPFSFQTVLPF
jgi:Ca2+-binding EF-hand superfamily protein